MFYAAEAILLDKGIRLSSHGAVHAAFGRELVLPGTVDPNFHRYLLDAFRARQTVVYEAPVEVSREDVLVQLRRAARFIAAVRAS